MEEKVKLHSGRITRNERASSDRPPKANLALTAPRNVLSKKAATSLALQRITSRHTSRKPTRLRTIVNSTKTTGIVHNVDINHGSASFVLHAKLTAGRSVVGSGNVRILDDVRIRRLVVDAAAVDEVGRGASGGQGGFGRSGAGVVGGEAVDFVGRGGGAWDVYRIVDLDGSCGRWDEAA